MTTPLQRSPAINSGSSEAVYQARWLIPDDDRLLSPGCVHVRNGHVVHVWEGTEADAVDLGDVAIVPGLVNAHTHLEFSDLTQPLGSGQTFPDWIRYVIQSRRERAGDGMAAVRQGWEECRTAGTAAVGEIATADASFDTLATAGAAGGVFREILGLREDAVESELLAARSFLRSGLAGRESQPLCDESLNPLTPTLSPAGEPVMSSSLASEGEGESWGGRATLVRGLSPHAPYSLHPRLFRGLVDLAVEAGVPVAMHLAETREELELLAHHRGGLVDLLTELGLWRAELFTEFRRPLDYLRELTRCSRALVVHGNYLTEEELDLLSAQPQMSVVYCPRTHAAFGHAQYSWRGMRERGIRVVLGTDSRASNPDLSMVHELRWLKRQFPDVADRTLLRMATSEAAQALGLEDQFGTLSPGKVGSFAVVVPSRPLTGPNLEGLFGAAE